jgi:para-aminobenzoate synthetase component 1
MWNQNDAMAQMNAWGKEREPFLFFIDFKGSQTWLSKLSEIDPEQVSYDFHGRSNSINQNKGSVDLSSIPIPKCEFLKGYEQVLSHIYFGNSFLTNLTFETPISIEGSLQDVFSLAKAKYKLRFKDEFVCFSPEIFVTISDNTIRSFPMKGTISSSIANAEETILKDQKEIAEHVTIVDLIRNDLSTVARNVRLERFRYIDEIKNGNGGLLQVSSEIVGDVDTDWTSQLGTLLFKLLPAGSICGAPKQKTLEIIKESETHHRGFYTGICGLFDGQKLDSGVMIRFIEKRDGRCYFKSGGGITAFSELDKEYQEYIDKIYVPVS